MILVILILLIIYCLSKCFSYYCALRGTLYYLGMKYNDMPDDKKLKELTLKAMDRTINEFFKKN